MAITYGYARCSTDESRQDIDRQKRELRTLGVVEDKHIYWEYESGIKIDRPEFRKLMDAISEGDTLVVTEVSRLTRSTKQLCEILQSVQDRRIRLVIGSFAVDCRSAEVDPMTKGMLLMWGVFSEMERDIISQRVRSGMKNAVAKGKRIGRPQTTVGSLPDKFWKYKNMYERGDISIAEFARLLDCSRTTIYKYLNIAADEKEG